MFVLAVACALAAPSSAVAQTAHGVVLAPQAFMVELASAPTAEGTALSRVRADQAAFRKAAKAAGISYTERRSFAVLFNGLAVDRVSGGAGALAQISGVKGVYPIGSVGLQPPQRTQLATAVTMTGADLARSQLGLTGAGVDVGIVDTGIDYDHPDLGGCFGTGCRVAKGHDFVGDEYDFDDPQHDRPVPDADPDDCNGHGTHVAGIAGADGEVDGVAPGVTLAAYRVFGCAGSTGEDVLLAAFERALADGMDVVNISLGPSYGWPSDPVSRAADRLVNKGVVVVGSIGNDGETGIFSAGGRALGRKAIAVGSVENSHVTLSAFSVTPDDRRMGYVSAEGAPPPPASGSDQLARTGTAASPDDACATLAEHSLAGRVALIRRGGCAFYEKAIHAQDAGATAVVIYNNAPELFGVSVQGTPAVAIPVVSLSGVDGEILDARVSGPDAVTLTWGQTVTAPNPSGGLISSFSSYGLTPDLALKPDLSAPGGLIRSTVPLEQGAYDTFSGTSMSSPHVAGAVALLLQAKPRTPASAVRDIFQNSADPVPAATGSLGPDSVHRQGAGLVDIDDAILATTRVTPGKLELGESESGPVTRTVTIANSANAPVTYALSHVPAVRPPAARSRRRCSAAPAQPSSSPAEPRRAR